MRVGDNPNRHKPIESEFSSHRVVIPIYIPNNEGYFKDSFNVLKVSIESLIKTINLDTKITLISNASSKEVNDYLNVLYIEGKIDRVILNKENVGKMNAIITETRASYEEFITYADADVFFDKGWLKNTFKIFKNVPRAGYVSMNPMPNSLGLSTATILDNLSLFSKKQKTKNICTYADLEHFHKSIGRNESFTREMFEEKNIFCVNNEYIIGAGHFCCTIKKTPTLKYVPIVKCDASISGGSEANYLDIPFDKTGLWKLSSSKAYVWHMGNVLDKVWANNKLNEIRDFKEVDFSFNNLKFKNSSFFSRVLPYKFRIKIVSLLKKMNAFN